MYYGVSGSQYNLGATPIKSGGEGSIYTVQGRPDCLVKIYHPSILNAELEEKLRTMYQNPPSPDVLAQIAWPIDVIYDANRKFAGFLMSKLSVTHDLDQVYKYPATDLAGVTLRHKLIIAQNICYVIAGVHKAGYVFGDFNPMNIGININDGTVAFFDADTYHFRDPKSGKTHRCRAGCPGYVAPELLSNCKRFQATHPNIKETYANAPLPTFTKETDNFALAIHIFKLIMNGFTPYNGIPETSPVSQASPGQGDAAVERNNYCFAQGKRPMAVAMPEFSSLPTYIQDMFTRAFEKGYSSPSLRPSAEEWMAPLAQYEQELKQCGSDRNHFYYNKLNRCPYCAADSRYKAEINKAMNTQMGGGQKKFTSAPVVQRPVVPPPGGARASSGTAHSTGSSTYRTSTTNAGASGHSGSSMSTGLKVLIGAILAIIAFIFFSVMSNVDRDTVTIINDDFSISVGQTAEVRIRSSASRLTADWNSCIDAEWNNDKSSGDMYYINITGATTGTCTLKIYKTANEDIYDTVAIQVVPADSDVAGTDAGITDASGNDVTVVPPIEKKHDSVNNAMKMDLNIEYTDSLKSSSESNWYSFTLPDDGYISVSFDHEMLNTDSYYWEMNLYREDGKTYYDGGSRTWYIEGDENFSTCNVGLPKGTYFLEVSSYSSSYTSNWSDKNYNFTVNFEVSEVWEAEQNNSRFEANEIAVNTTYYGALTSSYDTDWYSFTLETDGYINASFEHDLLTTDSYYWELYLYQEDGETYYDGGSRNWYVDGDAALTTCDVGLPAGTYYFVVKSYSSSYTSNWSDLDYHFTINYEESSTWESELNNNKYSADNISTNTLYYGALTSTYDTDWYTFTLEADGYINASFEHDLLTTDSYYWELYLYREDGETYYDGGSRNWYVDGDAALTTCDIGLPAGTYYFVVKSYSSSYTSNWSDFNYSFCINYNIASNWETELNNNKYEADSITFGLTYCGSVSSSYDSDWYAFSMGGGGPISISLEHELLTSDSYYWEISICKEDGTVYYRDGTYNWYVDGDENKYVNGVWLDAGNYYVVIEEYSSSYTSNWSSKTYSLTVQ